MKRSDYVLLLEAIIFFYLLNEVYICITFKYLPEVTSLISSKFLINNKQILHFFFLGKFFIFLC